MQYITGLQQGLNWANSELCTMYSNTHWTDKLPSLCMTSLNQKNFKLHTRCYSDRWGSWGDSPWPPTKGQSTKVISQMLKFYRSRASVHILFTENHDKSSFKGFLCFLCFSVCSIDLSLARATENRINSQGLYYSKTRIQFEFSEKRIQSERLFTIFAKPIRYNFYST